MVLLEVDNIHKTYNSIPTLKGLSFHLDTGEILGIVGESGCGKSTMARIICLLEKPDTGQIIFNSKNLLHLKPRDLKKYRREFQIIFQDPVSSLNPRMKIQDIIAEPLRNFTGLSRRDCQRAIAKVLNQVGLQENIMKRYPHQLSGGQQQRVNIARAVILKPKLLVCDEPTSSLDVSIQVQILNLLLDLKKDFNLSMVFISHDIGVIKYISNRVAVIYDGKIVEELNTNMLFNNAQHPYIKYLISCIPGYILMK